MYGFAKATRFFFISGGEGFCQVSVAAVITSHRERPRRVPSGRPRRGGGDGQRGIQVPGKGRGSKEIVAWLGAMCVLGEFRMLGKEGLTKKIGSRSG